MPSKAEFTGNNNPAAWLTWTPRQALGGSRSMIHVGDISIQRCAGTLIHYHTGSLEICRVPTSIADLVRARPVALLQRRSYCGRCDRVRGCGYRCLLSLTCGWIGSVHNASQDWVAEVMNIRCVQSHAGAEVNTVAPAANFGAKQVQGNRCMS